MLNIFNFSNQTCEVINFILFQSVGFENKCKNFVSVKKAKEYSTFANISEQNH